MPLRDRLWALRHGHHSQHVVMWGLNPDNLHEYIPEIPYLWAHPLNGASSVLIDSKFRMHLALQAFPHLLPKLYLFIQGGMAFGRDPSVPSCRRYRPEMILDLVDTVGAVFIKPDQREGGVGALHLERVSDEYRINGVSSGREVVLRRLACLDDHLVCERVEQHAYARTLFPGTANTIRMITLREDSAEAPEIVAAFHRVGTSDSVPVDNSARGGLFGGIDIGTGETRRFTRYPRSMTMDWYDSHPESGAQLRGVVVPGWESIRRQILEVASWLPMVQWMGFDVLVTADGLRILEINSLPTLAFQTDAPLGGVPSVIRFLKGRIRRRLVPLGAIDRVETDVSGGGSGRSRPS